MPVATHMSHDNSSARLRNVPGEVREVFLP